MEDLYKAFGDDTLSWVAKVNGKVYGNSVQIGSNPAILVLTARRLADDIENTLTPLLRPQNLFTTPSG